MATMSTLGSACPHSSRRFVALAPIIIYCVANPICSSCLQTSRFGFRARTVSSAWARTQARNRLTREPLIPYLNVGVYNDRLAKRHHQRR